MHFSRQLNCWSLRCSWSIACWHCSNYIFILHLTLGFNKLRKDNCKPRRKTFEFWHLVRLILETLRFSKEVNGSGKSDLYVIQLHYCFTLYILFTEMEMLLFWLNSSLSTSVVVEMTIFSTTCAGLILGLRPANERRRYKVTPSLIGWAQT